MTLPSAVSIGAGRSAVDGSWYLGAVVGVPEGEGGPAHLVVHDGIITGLRPVGHDGPGPDPSGVDDGPWLVLVPLLVNAHDHGRGWGNVVAGIADAPLEEWITSLRGGPSTQERLVGDGCRAMLTAGVGATVICVNPQSPDTAAEVLAAVDAARHAGVRAAVVYPIADAMGDLHGRERETQGWTTAETERHLDIVEHLARDIDDPTIELQLGPVGPQWVAESTLAAVGAGARRNRRRVHMHLLESPIQRRWADRIYPEGIVELLRRCDLLGEHVCVAHGTHLRPAEMQALADAGTVLSINVSSNLRLASGIPPVAEVQRSGMSYGAGLDGMALGDDADYWTELRLLRGVAQAQAGVTVDAGSLLETVTSGGSTALGACRPQPVGVGRAADFVLLDLRGYRHLAEDHGWLPADIALAAGRPDRVHEVWVNGRAVFSAGPSLSMTGGVS